MTTKTTKPETKNATQEVTESTEAAQATKSVADATKAVSGLFNALFTSNRKAIEGIIEVDKALLGYAKGALNGYVELGKETIKAKCLNDVIDLHAAHAHSSVEATAANAREVIELGRTKAKESYAPVKEVIDTYRPGKAA
jgi:hypothetical protein